MHYERQAAGSNAPRHQRDCLDDTFSLAAVSADPLPLESMQILVEPGKIDYLRAKKLGLITSTGIGAATGPELTRLFASRVRDNYVYDLRFREEHGERKHFNIMLEFRRHEHLTPTEARCSP